MCFESQANYAKSHSDLTLQSIHLYAPGGEAVWNKAGPKSSEAVRPMHLFQTSLGILSEFYRR